MIAKKWGRIINIASAHGLVGSPFKSAYVAAKHGMLGLTKVTALETAELGITCNAICPGYVYTPLVEAQIDGQAKAHGIPREQVIRDVLLAQQPNKRFATTDELGGIAVFLASDAAASITGSLDRGRRRLDRALSPEGARHDWRNREISRRSQAVNEIRNNNNGQVVLVLQGGGALGAYQGGVYQALHEAGVEPDWIIGTSIGAINAAIIAGNRVEDRLATLQEFWRRVERSTFWGAFPALTGVADALSSWTTLTSGIPGFFETNIRAFLGAHVPLGADHAGYYSTEPLRKTLEELVDFSLINQGPPAADGRRRACAHQHDALFRLQGDGDLRRATSWRRARCRRRFPAVRIDGELYWDGGILSNTPTERIFDDNPRRNSLIFAVHLWHPDRRRAGDHLADPQSSEGHPIFEPDRQPHRAPARDAQAPPRHHQPARVRARGGEERSALPGACRLSLRHAHACGAAAEPQAQQ